MKQVIFIAGLIACSTCFGGTIMPIIRSSRVLRIQMVAACGIWCFGFQVVGMVWN